MAILVNQNNNLSGENLLASSSLENSISEARNLSVSIDSKIADLKNKSNEIKTEAEITLNQVFKTIDDKEKSFTKNINQATNQSINNISKAIDRLKSARDMIQNIWIIPQAIMIHVILFIIELTIVLWMCLPTIKKAKEVLNDNEETIKISLERKKENERLREENQALENVKNDLYSFIVYSYGGSSEKAKQVYSKWKEQ